MTLPASVARFLTIDHSSADHMRTLQSKPAVIKNNPERGRASEEGVGVSTSGASVLKSSTSIPLPFAVPFAFELGASVKAEPFVVEPSKGMCGSSEVERKNLRSDTEDLWAGIMYCVFSARRSHIRTVSSPDPVATWYLLDQFTSHVDYAEPFGLTHLAQNPWLGSP